MQKVLITGGAGYIGSMLSTKLLDFGSHVTVIDLLKYFLLKPIVLYTDSLVFCNIIFNYRDYSNIELFMIEKY